MSEEKRRVRIDLTPEQTKLIKDTAGYEIAALDLSVEQLEARIAPSDFSFVRSNDASSPNMF